MKKKNLDIFFEISSKTSKNVVELFNRVAEELISKSVEIQNMRQSLADQENLRETYSLSVALMVYSQPP